MPPKKHRPRNKGGGGSSKILKPNKLNLSNLSCTLVNFGNTSLNVPLFLVDAFNSVTKNLKTEGLFRKSGNLQRIKNTKTPFFGDTALPEGLNAYDVCYLIKQFFREIEEPLFTYELEPQFLKFRCLQRESTQVKYLLELCHVLRPIHRETVAFLMRKLRQVTQKADVNKMDSFNLATVFWPSLFRVPCSKTDLGLSQRDQESGSIAVYEKKEADLKCSLLQILIENAEDIGVLSVYEKVMSPDMYDCLLPEDANIVANSKKRCRIIRQKRPTVLSLTEEFNTPSSSSNKKILRSDDCIVVGAYRKRNCRPKKLNTSNVEKSTIQLGFTHNLSHLEAEKSSFEVESSFKQPDPESSQLEVNSVVEMEPSVKQPDPETSQLEQLVVKVESFVKRPDPETNTSNVEKSTIELEFNKNLILGRLEVEKPAIEVETSIKPETSQLKVKTRAFKVEPSIKEADHETSDTSSTLKRSPSTPKVEVTEADNMDFENSQARKEMLLNQLENPSEFLTPSVCIGPKITVTDKVRPSVAYILRSRRGIVKENKALFEQTAKRLKL